MHFPIVDIWLENKKRDLEINVSVEDCNKNNDVRTFKAYECVQALFPDSSLD